MKKEIKEFLKSTEKELKFELTCPDQLMKAFEAVGGKVNGDSISTNGWQVDYWIRAKYKKQYFYLSGCAWYGNGKIERLDDTHDEDWYNAESEY